MKTLLNIQSVCILFCMPLPLLAAQLPVPSKSDGRIGYVQYTQDDVVELKVQRGTVTRIVLADDEMIIANGLATGFLADCASATSEWCIRAEAGTNHVFIKPKDNATHNNLELRTNRRDYSIALRVLPDTSHRRKQNSAQYRVVFRYPEADRNASNTFSGSEKRALNERMTRTRAAPRNWDYTMQILPGAQDFSPSLVFDDGRFTYFRFPANREIPTAFAVSNGEESRVNFHIDDDDDSLLVVERTARQFVLRLGTTAVGIWNEKFDPDGVATRNGTTVDGVKRELRQGAGHGN